MPQCAHGRILKQTLSQADAKWGPASLPTPCRRTSTRLAPPGRHLRLLVSAACSTRAANGPRLRISVTGPGAIPFRASTPRSPAASSTVRPKPDNRALATISGSPSTRCRAARLQPSRPTPFPCRGDGRERLEHPSLPVRQAFALATAGLPARSDIPPKHERFPCGTCSEFRHKLLMFLRFLASASSAYSHDAVIESESCKGSNDTAKLWITWISWRRFPGLRCMNGPLFPVHATSGTKEALRP